MTTTTKKARQPKTPANDPIVAVLSPPISRGLIACDVRTIQREIAAIRARYSGGLPAELASRNALLSPLRDKLEVTVLRGRGRRIDLAALLNQSRPTGEPVWSVVDPRHEVSAENGKIDVDGMIKVAGNWRTITGLRKRARAFVPTGLPALPARIRELLTGERYARMRLRAKWIGVLYQPEAWREVKPDPALVVEWKAIPGEYYALAVWGGDRANIMEFVS